MAAAPMDMLRKCREQFARQAEAQRQAANNQTLPDAFRSAAGTKAERNERLVAEIDATLREWG